MFAGGNNLDIGFFGYETYFGGQTQIFTATTHIYRHDKVWCRGNYF